MWGVGEVRYSWLGPVALPCVILFVFVALAMLGIEQILLMVGERQFDSIDSKQEIDYELSDYEEYGI